MVLTLAAAMAAGAAAGSFGCLLARRLARGEDWVATPSHCEACGAGIGPADLIPLVSFVLLRGRCRCCGARIPRDHLAAELAGAVLPLCAFPLVPAPLFWPSCALGWGLLVLSLVDLSTMRLPRPLSLGLLAGGLATVTLGIGADLLLPHALAALGGWAAFEALALAFRHLAGREGLGRGDALLLGAAGAWTGAAGLPSIVLIAALTGLAFGILTGAGRGRRIPFGPFLALGTWMTWLHGPVLGSLR